MIEKEGEQLRMVRIVLAVAGLACADLGERDECEVSRLDLLTLGGDRCERVDHLALLERRELAQREHARAQQVVVGLVALHDLQQPGDGGPRRLAQLCQRGGHLGAHDAVEIAVVDQAEQVGNDLFLAVLEQSERQDRARLEVVLAARLLVDRLLQERERAALADQAERHGGKRAHQVGRGLGRLQILAARSGRVVQQLDQHLVRARVAEHAERQRGRLLRRGVARLERLEHGAHSRLGGIARQDAADRERGGIDDVGVTLGERRDQRRQDLVLHVLDGRTIGSDGRLALPAPHERAAGIGLDLLAEPLAQVQVDLLVVFPPELPLLEALAGMSLGEGVGVGAHPTRTGAAWHRRARSGAHTGTAGGGRRARTGTGRAADAAGRVRIARAAHVGGDDVAWPAILSPVAVRRRAPESGAAKGDAQCNQRSVHGSILTEANGNGGIGVAAGFCQSVFRAPGDGGMPAATPCYRDRHRGGALTSPATPRRRSAGQPRDPGAHSTISSTSRWTNGSGCRAARSMASARGSFALVHDLRGEPCNSPSKAPMRTRQLAVPADLRTSRATRAPGTCATGN
ncbi:MAG: hypothetical protein U1E76_07080 [Planctomycetota bacterium]